MESCSVARGLGLQELGLDASFSVKLLISLAEEVCVRIISKKGYDIFWHMSISLMVWHQKFT